MAWVEPLPEDQAVDKVARSYERIKELLGTDSVPPVFLLYGRVGPFLQDFYMNFKKFVFTDGELDRRTKLIIALAVSAHSGSRDWIEFFVERLQQEDVDPAQVPEVFALVATNSMYNTFFKFRDISGSDVFEGMSVGLRAHTFQGTSLEDTTVELINLVISDINGCKPCTSGHVAQARQLGLSDARLLEAVQCAATMQAGIQFLKSAGGGA